MKHLKNIRELCPALLLCGALSFLLFLYAPLEVYVTNIDDFPYDFADLMRMMLPVFLIVFLGSAALLFLLSLLSNKLFRFLMGIGFAAFLAVYCQGTFLAGNLPALDGSTINWAEYDYQRLPSVLLWLACILAVFLLARWKKEVFLKIISGLCAGVLLMLLLSGGILCVSEDALRDKEDIVATNEYLLDMSTDENFVILLLDSISADAANDVLQQDAEAQSAFDGFTFFKNTVGAYPFTVYTIPYLFSGEYYENQESFYIYKERAYADSPLFRRLEDLGFRIGLYEDNMSARRESTLRFENAEAIDTRQFALPAEFIKTQLKLVGLKYMPYDLKRYCTITPDMMQQNFQKVMKGGTCFNWDNGIFYDTLQTQSIVLGEQEVFRFIHLVGAHEPYVYDADMNRPGADTDYDQSVAASLTLAEAYLNKLKESGVYDNSVIIIMADHGDREDERQNPLLMVKGISETHALSVSEAPISFADLQDAFTCLLNRESSEDSFPWQEGDVRERRYLRYYFNQEDTMFECLQTGYADDMSTLIETGNVYRR